MLACTWPFSMLRFWDSLAYYCIAPWEALEDRSCRPYEQQNYTCREQWFKTMVNWASWYSFLVQQHNLDKDKHRQWHSACVIFTCSCLNLAAEPKMKHARNTQWIPVRIMQCKRFRLADTLATWEFETKFAPNFIRAWRSSSQSTQSTWPFSKAIENIDINLPRIGVASVAKFLFRNMTENCNTRVKEGQKLWVTILIITYKPCKKQNGH